MRIAWQLIAVLVLGIASTLGNNQRPNFLFILTDDQSPETLRTYGNTVCDTPNIDRLAAEGMTIVDAHHMGSWSGAVCTPSRTMIMTGRTLWKIPGSPRHEDLSADARAEMRQQAAAESLPAVFHAAGYDTFRTCKEGNSFPEANALFTVRREATKREATREGGSWWHGAQVVEYLEHREATGDRDPFLIYFGFSHPHDPRHAPPDLAAKYGASNDGPATASSGAAPLLPVNYLPAHPFPHGHPGLRDEEQVQGVRARRDEATIRNELGREYACIEHIDRQIGRVLAKLEAMGELDSTYVFFTSDHGIAVGRHGLVGKQNLYEHTWRVPFIVRGPGIAAGSRASGFLYLLDVFPTMCDLAGIDVPEGVEGKSFRPVLEGRSERIRDTLYGAYCGGTKPGMRSIKTSDGWKLIAYDVLGGTVRETQLFDLRTNPHELLAEHHAEAVVSRVQNRPTRRQRDLAEVPEFQARKRSLRKLLEQEMARLGDPYALAE